MPAATQLRSCSMRCADQVGLEVVMLFGVIAIGTGLVAIAVSGRWVDGLGSDGAIDARVDARVDESVMDGLAVAAADWAADRAMAAHNRQPRDNKTSKRKSVRALEHDPEKLGAPFSERSRSQSYAIHRAASHLKDRKPAVGATPVRRTK